MKQEVSTPMMIGIIAVIVLIIAFIGWKVFAQQASGGSTDQLKAAKARKAKREGD